MRPPFAPMEALSVDEIPTGSGWQYEPKWDGFRCLVFRNGGKVDLQSKSGRSLTRYFPELVEAILNVKARNFAIDGEIVVPHNGTFSFADLLHRIHPAQSRVKRLAAETPALLIVFDLLAGSNGQSLTNLPLRERRRKLRIATCQFAGAIRNPLLRLRSVPIQCFPESRRGFAVGRHILVACTLRRVCCLPREIASRAQFSFVRRRACFLAEHHAFASGLSGRPRNLFRHAVRIRFQKRKLVKTDSQCR